MKKQQHLHHRGASTSSIVNKEFFIPLHRSITDNHEEKHQQDKHRSPIAKFVCKLLGLDSHNHRHNNNSNRRPRLDHKSNSTTSITKSSVIQISSSLSTNNNNNNTIHPSINKSNHHHHNKKEQEDNCSIHSSASSSSSLISTSLSSLSNNNDHHSQHKNTNNKKSSSSSSTTTTSKPLESSLSSLTSSVITSPQNDCILIHHQNNKEELSYHHYSPIKNDQLTAMDALVIASQLPTVRKIQFVDDLDMSPPTLTDRYSSTNPILNEALAEQLRPYLPRRYRLAGEWNLLYSLDQHGASLSTLYNHVDETGPCILILKDDELQVFGAFLNEYIHPETSYYGTGECFLWKMTSNDKQQLNEKNNHPIPKIKTFSFTGRNEYMIYSTYDCIAIGGGHGKFGLWLNKDLEKCHSEPCDTFDNECLSLNHHFNCIGLEIWSFRF